jgi:hypothetical protein
MARPFALPFRSPFHLATVLMVGGLGAFTLSFARKFAMLANSLTFNADLVSPMIIADTVATTKGHHDVVFGTYAPYTTVWFNVITRRLPFHREIWETAPMVLSLLGVSLLVCVSWRLAGKWAALATLAIGGAWSQPVMVTLIAQAIHGTTYFVVCLLGAFLVFIAGRRRSPAVTAAGVVVVGFIAGVNLASDSLLLLVGIAPLVGAPVLAAIRSWTQGSRRAVVVAGGCGATAGLVSVITVRVMEAAGYRAMGVSQGSPLALATISDILGNGRQLATNLLDVWSADFPGKPFTLTTIARAALALPALAVVALPVVLLLCVLRTPAATEEARPQRLYVIFWGLVVGALITGVIFSKLAAENAYRSINYLTPIVFAVAATLPLVASRARWARAAVGVGATLLCALSTVDLLVPAKVQPGVPALAYVAEGPSLIATLERSGLTRGYSGYVSASVFTYQSGGWLTVRPVFPCLLAPGRPSVCGFFANRVKSWYVPQPGLTTFLITDPSLPAGVASAPAELGPPSAVIPIGVQTIYVYPYDIAAKFGPTF